MIVLYLGGITIMGTLMARRIKNMVDFFMGGRRFGKPMMINKTTKRIAQFGTSKTGSTCAMPCESAHPPTMYATATL